MGALSGALAVVCGAFAAHALRARLGPEMLSVFETGARYQLAHAPALIVAAWALDRRPAASFRAAAWLFLVGTALFSGSLYALALGAPRGAGVVTPLGGLGLIGGWLALGWGFLRGPGLDSRTGPGAGP